MSLRTRNVRDWSEFEAAIQKLETERKLKCGRVLNAPLFRGQGSSGWKLETTLERAYPVECVSRQTFLEYYRTIGAAKPVIETLSGKEGPGIPDFPSFCKRLRSDGIGWLDALMNDQSGVWEWLAYVRHHGFPSPLLDWTASPYVAAFFAFDSPPPKARQVSVHALLQDTIHGGSADQHLFIVGPYIRAHPRHSYQQCRYTMCVGRDVANDDYVFRSHESGLRDALGPAGKLVKITIPVGQRVTALRRLEEMNINAFSLFGSEDSLVRMIARQLLLLEHSTPAGCRSPDPSEGSGMSTWTR